MTNTVEGGVKENVRLFGGRGEPGCVLTAGLYTLLAEPVPAILTALILTSYSLYGRRPLILPVNVFVGMLVWLYVSLEDVGRYSMMYDVTGEPPSLEGALHVTEREEEPVA